MGLYATVNKNPTPSERLQFGLVVLVGFSAIGAFQYLHAHRHELAIRMVVTGAVVLAASLVPPVGRVLYILWMGLGVTIGRFTQPMFMAVAYGLLFIPLGLLFRAVGRDAMRRKARSGVASYWEDYPQTDDLRDYFKQY